MEEKNVGEGLSKGQRVSKAVEDLKNKAKRTFKEGIPGLSSTRGIGSKNVDDKVKEFFNAQNKLKISALQTAGAIFETAKQIASE